MEAEVIEQQDPGKAYSEIQVVDSDELTKAPDKEGLTAGGEQSPRQQADLPLTKAASEGETTEYQGSFQPWAIICNIPASLAFLVAFPSPMATCFQLCPSSPHTVKLAQSVSSLGTSVHPQDTS